MLFFIENWASGTNLIFKLLKNSIFWLRDSASDSLASVFKMHRCDSDLKVHILLALRF